MLTKVISIIFVLFATDIATAALSNLVIKTPSNLVMTEPQTPTTSASTAQRTTPAPQTQEAHVKEAQATEVLKVKESMSLREWCSGALINNRAGTTFLLTSNNCLSNYTEEAKYLVNEGNSRIQKIDFNKIVRHDYRELLAVPVDLNRELIDNYQIYTPAKARVQNGEYVKLLGLPHGHTGHKLEECLVVGTDIAQVTDIDEIDRYKIYKEISCPMAGSPERMVGGPVLNQYNEVVGVLIEIREKDPQIRIGEKRIDEEQKIKNNEPIKDPYQEGDHVHTTLYFSELLPDDFSQNRVFSNLPPTNGYTNEYKDDGNLRISYNISADGKVNGKITYWMNSAYLTDVYGTNTVLVEGHAQNGLIHGTQTVYNYSEPNQINKRIYTETFKEGQLVKK